jgi:hypothetical protein
MNIEVVLLWGFGATLILTTILAVSKPIGITRMDLPFLLGTLFTGNRDKAPWYGFLCHLLFGWFFAFLYTATFITAGIHTWWFGLLIGFCHAVFVLSVGLQILSNFHPRMAPPYQGPTPTRQLEPPGFLALNYGSGTPVVTIFAHMIYGAILGSISPEFLA